MDKNQKNETENNNENLPDQVGVGRSDDNNVTPGGLSDMTGATRRDTSNSTGSGMHSKSNLTGSDLDGQVADQ